MLEMKGYINSCMELKQICNLSAFFSTIYLFSVAFSIEVNFSTVYLY